jgi:Uncharacterised nucleotidyltransferase
MRPAQEDVFRLLCALLAFNRGVREHTCTACDPVTAAALVALADEERVGPALHEATVSSRWWHQAESQRDLLARAWEQNRSRNQHMRSTLLSLAEAAEGAGFQLIALKGCAWLVEDATNAAPWRSILDVDVLVDPAWFDALPRFLSELGYQRASHSRRFRGNFHHAPHWRPDTQFTIEMHRHLGWRHQLLAPELIFKASTHAAPGLLQPVAWCRAFHAIIHWQIQDCGFSRRSVPLKEVLEVARFMARPDVDWAILVAHARAVGVLRECEAGMALAAELLGAPIPAELKPGALGKKHVRRALACRSSPLSTWLATEVWRAGTLWRCEKVAYRACLRGAKPGRVAADVWMGRAVRLPFLAVRAFTTGIRGAGLWIEHRCRRAPESGAASQLSDSSDNGWTVRLYDIYGLVVASELELPELASRVVRSAAAPDLKIRFGGISAALIAAAGDRILHAQNEQILLSVPRVARYCVTRGSQVVVEPEPGVDATLVRLFLLGSVIGLVCQQRGVLALHASAVAINGEAVAFLGQQGQGKSTLAAHCLAHSPARLVADDILVVSLDNAGRPWAHPGMPALKLWRDALQALGRGAEGLRPDWIRAEKFILPIADQLLQAPSALKCVYALYDDDQAGDGLIEELSGASAAAALVANTYRVEYLDFTGHRLAHFAASTRLAETVPVLRLARARDLMRVGSTAAIVLTDFLARTRPGELTSSADARARTILQRRDRLEQSSVTQ